MAVPKHQKGTKCFIPRTDHDIGHVDHIGPIDNIDHIDLYIIYILYLWLLYIAQDLCSTDLTEEARDRSFRSFGSHPPTSSIGHADHIHQGSVCPEIHRSSIDHV